MFIITTGRSSRPLATPIHPMRFCAEYPFHASRLPLSVLSSVGVSMRRRAIHKRFSPCGETCLKQGNCQAVPPGDGTSCSCGNPDGVRVCLAKERCPSGDLSEFNGDLGLCTIVASALSPETLTDTDTATSTNTATTGTDTHTASLTSGPMGSPTGTPTALPSSENLSPTQTADPAETSADTPTSTSGILPLTSSSPEDISSPPAPSSPSSRPISTSSSASSPIIASPNTIFPATATVTQTSPVPHEPPPKLIIALSASFGILLVALMTAVMLIYRRRRHRAVAHDASQAGSVVVHSSREGRARGEGTLAIDTKADMSASNSTLVVATPAAAVVFGPTPADVDTSHALFPRPCDVPITPSTTRATFSCAPDLGAHDGLATTLGVEEPGKVRASEQREREPPNNPLVAPPTPHSIPPDIGVHEDQFGMSQAVPAHAHAYVHRERRFVTVLMEVDSDGGSEGGYDTERPPPYQPRPRGVVGDPS
ncbi:hypothetical protein C2E23DRAFT_461161 [Lenzites betulinus]|nr:hypothetical protein C2E23DRAFT_461161 [Lenzites betulinus]